MVHQHHEDVVVQEEEEDIGTAMQKLQIPFKELEQLPIDSVYDFADGVRDIIDDYNLLLEDFNPSNNNNSIDVLKNSKPLQKSSRICFRSPPKRSRNKRLRRKRQCFKSAVSLFDSKKSCTHCETRSTPLWREGPKGAGTLCNACGMRYRSGRLLPEYRPASSPGFKPNVHSNFHRKVMKIRSERSSPPNSFGF
ncbi:hypothetical protein AALP_AA1G250900 [Arabis alpina]|uniref:GATA-type domain-containing protein n=1 Tax=Arabis alpina TaxID=50452 RepID=A0A087HQI5_ARAAL|nr:hypothetical protein AALP_AA1G250900 [Arabis alpina]